MGVETSYVLDLTYKQKDLNMKFSFVKLFFDEYESKGANIYYSIYYVDSAEPKGTVVEMSTYGQFIPLESTIWIGISKGNLTTSLPDVPDTPDPELQGLSDTGAEIDVSVEATP